MASEKYNYPKEALEYYGNLKKHKKVSDSISTNYYPEGKEPAGFMKIRIPDGEIVEHENASMFAAPHVRRELKRIAKIDNTPKEKTVIWY